MKRQSPASDSLSTPLLTVCLALGLFGCSGSGPTEPSAVPQASGLPPLAPVTGTGSLSPSTATTFSFVAFGDNQGDTNDPTVMQRIFDDMANAQPKPAFILSLGDIVHGKDPQKTPATIRASFDAYIDQVAKAGIPVFNAPGNHEMDDRDDKPNDKMHNLYTQTVGGLYGAFDYGNSRFIALNTSDIPPAGVCENLNDEGLECSYISDDHLSQLESDLQSNQGKTHIFVFMHYPIKPRRSTETLNPDIVSKLEGIFAKYSNIAFVFASHEHLYYNPDDPGNFKTIAPYKAGEPARYLVSGGAGAWLDDRPETKDEAFYHYLLVNVNGPDVTVTIHRIETNPSG